MDEGVLNTGGLWEFVYRCDGASGGFRHYKQVTRIVHHGAEAHHRLKRKPLQPTAEPCKKTAVVRNDHERAGELV